MHSDPPYFIMDYDKTFFFFTVASNRCLGLFFVLMLMAKPIGDVGGDVALCLPFKCSTTKNYSFIQR